MAVIILLIIVGIAAMFCLIAGIVCLLAASNEIQLPDIEDIEISEDMI
jgi:hypothetical protein